MARYHMTADGPVPFTTEEEMTREAEEAAFVRHQTVNGYKAKRAAEYPSIGDQLDALFKAGVFPAGMAAMLQAVKDKYPKG